jgi:hemin uptake protein HemP
LYWQAAWTAWADSIAAPADLVRRGTPDMSTKTITSAELFGKLREIVILHAGEEYRLRITSNGKLILTK